MFFFAQKETIILTKILTEKPRTKKNYKIVLLGPSVVFIEQHTPPAKPSATPPLKAWTGRSPHAAGKLTVLGTKAPPSRTTTDTSFVNNIVSI
jgi:hypothetical protein